jgi:hypothetical protein
MTEEIVVRLRDLSTAQIRMLIRLDDGFPHEDSVGRELHHFIGHEQRTVDSLVDKGLVELVPGRGLEFWFRLTKDGRRVREEG